jgi:hypothetical protein
MAKRAWRRRALPLSRAGLAEAQVTVPRKRYTHDADAPEAVTVGGIATSPELAAEIVSGHRKILTLVAAQVADYESLQANALVRHQHAASAPATALEELPRLHSRRNDGEAVVGRRHACGLNAAPYAVVDEAALAW